MIRHLTLIIGFSFLFFSCKEKEANNTSDVNPDSIWFDYKISGQEGDELVTVMLQFRHGGAYGGTLLLDAPSKVELDGELLKVDSSRMTGAFYELLKPIESFSGNHTILYTDIDGKEHREEFRFQPVSLTTELPVTIRRSDILLEFEGLDPIDVVRVLLTDTSFTGEGINRVDTVRDGKLLISKDDLAKLASGPVNLELIRENDRKVRAATKKGGRISITFGLRREFLLID